MSVVVITPGTQVEVVVLKGTKSVSVPVSSVIEAERWVNNLRSIGLSASWQLNLPD